MIVAITTAPRPRPAIVESLRSLRDDAGYTGAVAVFDDGCAQELPQEVLHIQNAPAKGSLPNFFAALKFLLDRKADPVIMLEDDILWAKGAWDIALTEYRQFKRPVLYSLHTSWTVSKPLEKRLGFSPLPRGAYDLTFNKRGGGSNAYIMPRWVAKRLWTHPGLRSLLRDMDGWSLEEVNVQSRRDNRITQALVSLRIPIMFRIPSLCNHELGKLNSSEYEKRGAWETNYFEPQARQVPIHG